MRGHLKSAGEPEALNHWKLTLQHAGGLPYSFLDRVSSPSVYPPDSFYSSTSLHAMRVELNAEGLEAEERRPNVRGCLVSSYCDKDEG